MALVIDVKVVPSAGCVSWKLQEGDRLKCYLKSSPEKGKANKELIELLSKALQLPGSACIIISGATSRLKRVRIDTSQSVDTLFEALGIERQMKLF